MQILTSSKAALALMMAAISSIATGCGKSATVAKTPIPVRVATVQQIDLGNGVRYSANIAPTSQVDLSFKSNGYVKTIRMVTGADGRPRKVDQGDWVKKGVVLAVVDQQEYEDKLQQARAQLDRAQADLEKTKLQFDRTSILYNSKSATKPDLDRDRAQFDSALATVSSAKAQVSEAQQALEYCSLRAPFDGFISKRNVDIGALVGPATNGFSLIDTRQVKAVFGIPDTAINRVRLGDTHLVATDAFGEAFEGKVTSISPSADPKSRVYSVEITIQNPHERLKAGMIATIALSGEQLAHPVVVVPLEAVIRDPQRPSGFAVMLAPGSEDTTVAEVRSVELGDAYGNVVAIASGIKLGERVVTRGSTLLATGDRVRIIP